MAQAEQREVRPEKIEAVSKVAGKLRKCESVILADFKGLTVAQVTQLRNDLRAKGVEFKVLKNRLGKRALAQAGCDALDDLLKGNTAWAFGVEDPSTPAKIMLEFAKANDKLVLKGGLLGGRRVDKASIPEVAQMPGRRELLGQMAGVLQQPATQVAAVMNAGVTKVLFAFNALADKLEAAHGGEAA